MRNSDYVIFDVETGGLDDEKNPLLEIALIHIHRTTFKEISRFTCLIQPYDDLTIERAALKANGIKMSDLAEGLTKKVAFKSIREFLKSANVGRTKFTRPIMVAHNSPFDIGFTAAFFKANNDNIWNYIMGQQICTQLECKKLDILGKLNLAKCCEHFGITLVNAHRAIADTEATVKLLIAIITQYRNGGGQEVKKKKDEKILTNKKSRDKFKF